MQDKESPNIKKLTPAECAVVISIDILSKAGKPTTPKQIADFLKEDIQTVRNILERLERVHRLTNDIESILQQHPEILDWAKVGLGIKDKNEVIEYINKRVEEIKPNISKNSEEEHN